MDLLLNLALGATFICALGLLGAIAAGTASRTAKRRLIAATRAGPLPESRTRVQIEERVLRAVRAFRRCLGIPEDSRLRERFIAAGLESGQSMELYFAARLLFPFAGILGGSFFSRNTLFAMMALAICGYMLPQFWLDRRVKRRRERIRKSLPDSIDLLVICVEAGLGLDQAMLRAGRELVLSHPEINQEFLQINREQRAGKPRIDAWRSMAGRTRLPDVEAFVGMLVQTERFGTPITRALSTFADGLRLRRRQIAEERAAKTTVKMIFPLVVFVFPCMFIVLLGPAIIGISRGFSSLMK